MRLTTTGWIGALLFVAPAPLMIYLEPALAIKDMATASALTMIGRETVSADEVDQDAQARQARAEEARKGFSGRT